MVKVFGTIERNHALRETYGPQMWKFLLIVSRQLEDTQGLAGLTVG